MCLSPPFFLLERPTLFELFRAGVPVLMRWSDHRLPAFYRGRCYQASRCGPQADDLPHTHKQQVVHIRRGFFSLFFFFLLSSQIWLCGLNHCDVTDYRYPIIFNLYFFENLNFQWIERGRLCKMKKQYTWIVLERRKKQFLTGILHPFFFPFPFIIHFLSFVRHSDREKKNASQSAAWQATIAL